MSNWSKDEQEAKSTIWRWGWWITGTLIVLFLLFGVLGKGCSFMNKIVDPDKAVSSYENFYQMHEQADQICNDIYVMQGADSISGGFSRNERIMGLENRLNDVIRDYNAQSKAWTRSMWKGEDLPYTLRRSDFNCK